MEVVVTGIGLISSLGKSLDANWQQLIHGKSGIKLSQPFLELAPRPLALIDREPAELTKLTRLVVASALKDASLAPPLPNCGVVIGSSRSQQAAWEHLARHYYWTKRQGDERDKGRQCVALVEEFVATAVTRERGRRGEGEFTCSSMTTESNLVLEDWLDTLPHMNAIASARQIESHSLVLAPMNACATGIWAIASAAELVKTGQCQQVIAGAVEAPITPLTLAGFKQMGALANTGAYPFDRRREGLVLGEGAAVLVLESAESAKQRAAKVYGQVLGSGLTSDAYHGNVPEPSGRSAIAAVKQCLDRSNLLATDIDYIHAHGTATQLNDRHEAKLIQYLFPQGVPVSSTKGATGHTLGASGALGAAFCLMALQHQIMPPCVGLRSPEFDLDLVTAPRQGEIKNVLCLSFGFGGQNAAIALKKCH